MMIENLSIGEIITGIVGVVVILAGTFYKLGFVHFGRNHGCADVLKKGKCPDPVCQERQSQLTDDVKEIKPKVMDMAEGVAYLKGWAQGRKKSGDTG